MQYSFSKKEKFKKNDYCKNLKNIKIKSKIHTHNFLFIAKKNELEFSRLGMAIKKKFAGNIVKRNIIKRQIRETFRLANKTTNLDIIVILKSKYNEITKNNIRKELVKVWQKIF